MHIIVDCQNEQGAWRYNVFSRDSDISVTVCQLQALRAIRNVAANAIEWAPPGGAARVDIDGTADAVVVSVDDNGPGVPEGLRSEVFQPFAQAPAAAGQRAGFGLGLAITRSAVERQGGTARITESPAGGARLVLSLPRVAGSVPVGLSDPQRAP